MRNAGLEETQTGIKTAGRNLNNLRYADDTTLMAESEEAYFFQDYGFPRGMRLLLKERKPLSVSKWILNETDSC